MIQSSRVRIQLLLVHGENSYKSLIINVKLGNTKLISVAYTLQINPETTWVEHLILPNSIRRLQPYSQRWKLPPAACTIKHNGFVIYGFHNKLVCLINLVSFVTGNRKDTGCLINLSIYRKLQICNVLELRSLIDTEGLTDKTWRIWKVEKYREWRYFVVS